MRLINSNDVEPAKPSEAVQRLLESMAESRLKEWVRKVSVPRHYMAEAGANRATGEWIERELNGFGYEVKRQGSCGNIIASPASEFKEVVLVGAHYDSVPGSPGADDNGSAVAAMLGCAAACAIWQPKPAVIFAAFNREEDGFIGSREFVEEWTRREGVRIRCAHILEMVGYASSESGSQRLPTGLPIKLPERGDFLGLLANGASAGEMMRILELSRAYTSYLPVTGLEVIPGAERVFPVLARSDHVPFWQNSIPAVMWTDTAEFRNPHYHNESDRPETLDYQFLRQVARLLAAVTICE